MKILFVHQGLESYVKTDLDILRSFHQVNECYFPGVRQQGGIRSTSHIFRLLRGLRWCDLSFSWFGKIHAFYAVLLSKMLKKRAAVVLSGGEVVRFSFGNGRYKSLCTRPLIRWFPISVAVYADLLLPVSWFAYHEAIVSVGAKPKRMVMIHHGFDPDVYQRDPSVEKDGSVITVSGINDEYYHKKRLQEFVEAGKFMSDSPFKLIGLDKGDGTAQRLKAVTPPNVDLTGGLYGSDLVKMLSQSSVYVQASVVESFACALAEAMLCECVPVVSKQEALAEVAGDCGIYLDEPVTPKEIAAKVRQALQHPELGHRARQRVVENFSLERRRRALLEALELMA